MLLQLDTTSEVDGTRRAAVYARAWVGVPSSLHVDFYQGSARIDVERATGISNILFVLALPLKNGVLSEYPAEFFVLESPSNYYHGMREIETLLRNAKRHAAWDSKRIAYWIRNPYRAVLHRIRRVNRNRSLAN